MIARRLLRLPDRGVAPAGTSARSTDDETNWFCSRELVLFVSPEESALVGLRVFIRSLIRADDDVVDILNKGFNGLDKCKVWIGGDEEDSCDKEENGLFVLNRDDP